MHDNQFMILVKYRRDITRPGKASKRFRVIRTGLLKDKAIDIICQHVYRSADYGILPSDWPVRDWRVVLDIGRTYKTVWSWTHGDWPEQD
jgi:hypothetical protein